MRNVAQYVLSLSGSPHDSVAAKLGKSKFVMCAACHGPEGKGNPALGAPNLTDKVWLHGWGEETIAAMINGGKNNAMPAHASRLTPEQVRVLAAYVWRMSNGTAKVAASATEALMSDAATRHRRRLRSARTDRLALREAEEDLSACGQRLVRGLALGARVGDPARLLRHARGWSGTRARPCCSTWPRGASTSSASSCTRRTSSS